MGFDWLKTGAAAKSEVAAMDEREAQREEDRKNKVPRFYIPSGMEKRVTFLDGSLGPDGTLKYESYNEHQLYMNGHHRNYFTCAAITLEDGTKTVCPICEQGERYSTVFPFTVIDHSTYKDKAGTVHHNEIKLYLAKRGTLKQLEMLAVKHPKGLVGCTFDIGRPEGDKIPGVGNMFQLVERLTVKQLREQFKVKGPLNYHKTIPFKSEEELRKMGFGLVVPGNETSFEDEEEEGGFGDAFEGEEKAKGEEKATESEEDEDFDDIPY